MDLHMFQQSVLDSYTSNSQKARVLTENWFASQMYCPCCLKPKISVYNNNKKVSDFFCDSCRNDFQLKSSKNRSGVKF